MISKLNKSEFTKRLKQNTKIGDPNSKGTPFAILKMFGQTKEKFYGEFTTSNFRLTKNATFLPIPYIFEGKLKSKSNSSTEVLLKIKPIWFGYLWIRILPTFALISINLLFIINGNNIEPEIFITVNIFLAFMFTPILIKIKLKNKLLKDFYKTFEICD